MCSTLKRILKYDKLSNPYRPENSRLYPSLIYFVVVVYRGTE